MDEAEKSHLFKWVTTYLQEGFSYGLHDMIADLTEALRKDKDYDRQDFILALVRRQNPFGKYGFDKDGKFKHSISPAFMEMMCGGSGIWDDINTKTVRELEAVAKKVEKHGVRFIKLKRSEDELWKRHHDINTCEIPAEESDSVTKHEDKAYYENFNEVSAPYVNKKGERVVEVKKHMFPYSIAVALA